MQEGLEQSRVARYDSQVAKYFEAEVRNHHMFSRILNILFVLFFQEKYWLAFYNLGILILKYKSITNRSKKVTNFIEIKKVQIS